MCLDDGRVVSNFVAQALRREPMTVYGDGKQTRSFQYVSDLVEGLMRLMEGEDVGPFNLGNPSEFTMLELANAKELLGWKLEAICIFREGLPLMVSDFRQRLFGDQKDPSINTFSFV
uniref:NAD-dependent epimerase/dehydratase domain-containing protein n=1 Tax=Lactuca sativa TaxID=4236 RepID=A0A9R1VAY9_LACSA|nr:hypothetical protein LSAT_V11C600334770 [Lactuca sativa]